MTNGPTEMPTALDDFLPSLNHAIVFKRIGLFGSIEHVVSIFGDVYFNVERQEYQYAKNSDVYVSIEPENIKRVTTYTTGYRIVNHALKTLIRLTND